MTRPVAATVPEEADLSVIPGVTAAAMLCPQICDT